ncbi:phage portal protein [Mycobacterium sp. ZZG]
MTTPDVLVAHLQALLAPQHLYAWLRDYYEGRSPLSFLSADQKVALKNFDRISSNVCETTVTSIQERLRVSGFTITDAWDLYVANNFDQRATNVHRDALLYGGGYVTAWKDNRGRPSISIESPDRFVVVRDPITDEVVSGCKRVITDKAVEAWLYFGDEIQHWRVDSPSASTAGFYLVDSVENPLGVPPIAVVGHEGERSVIDNVTTLQDALNKALLDGLTASESAAFPRRWASGISPEERPVLDDDGNPVLDEGEPVVELVNPLTEDRLKTWISDDADSRFGQLDAADLNAFESLVRVIMSQVQMVTGLPAHYVGVLQNSVTSADALRAAEAALVSRVEAKQLHYGTGHERLAQLLLAIRDGGEPDDIPVRVQWAPADTRSVAQEMDATVKAVQAGIYPVTYALAKLGHNEDEIQKIMADREAEIRTGQRAEMDSYLRLQMGMG